MKRQDFYYDLPQELIAQDPLEDRSSSRLLVLDKKTGETQHHTFREVINYLNPGDCLVIKDTKVIPGPPDRREGRNRRKDRGTASETGTG